MVKRNGSRAKYAAAAGEQFKGTGTFVYYMKTIFIINMTLRMTTTSISLNRFSFGILNKAITIPAQSQIFKDFIVPTLLCHQERFWWMRITAFQWYQLLMRSSAKSTVLFSFLRLSRQVQS